MNAGSSFFPAVFRISVTTAVYLAALVAIERSTIVERFRYLRSLTV